MGDDELEAIRRRRLAELQARRAQGGGIQEEAIRQAAEEQAREEADSQREAVLRQILTPEARQRLTRLRMARPEESRMVESQLIQLAQSGRLQARLDDEQLKLVLGRILPANRDIKIQRK